MDKDIISDKQCPWTWSTHHPHFNHDFLFCTQEVMPSMRVFLSETFEPLCMRMASDIICQGT